jgi:hypothetical protein
MNETNSPPKNTITNPYNSIDDNDNRKITDNDHLD